MLLYRPFEELKDNVIVSILEIGFTVGCFFVPFFVEHVQEDVMADVFIYWLMGISAISSVVSFVFTIIALRKKCVSKMQEREEKKRLNDEDDIGKTNLSMTPLGADETYTRDQSHTM